MYSVSYDTERRDKTTRIAIDPDVIIEVCTLPTECFVVTHTQRMVSGNVSLVGVLAEGPAPHAPMVCGHGLSHWCTDESLQSSLW